VLGLAQQHIARYGAFQSCLEAPVTIEQHQPNAVVRQAVHERCGQLDVAKAHQAADMVQRNAEPDFMFHLDPYGVVLQVEIAFRGGDVERVE